MAKNKEVPKTLVSFKSDDLSDDTGLISPELLFENYENENLISYPQSGTTLGEFSPITLGSPESLFGKSSFKKVKLKSPEELFAKPLKPSGNGKENKHLPVKKDKKSGK